MDWIQAIFLGLIQGITEFLPISSSGHLILVPHFFGWKDQGLLFDVAANTGSLVAVLLYFRQDIKKLSVGFFLSLRHLGFRDNPEGKMAWFIGLGTIPVGLAGLLAGDLVATLARNPQVIGTTSIVFGLLLWWSDKQGRSNQTMGMLTWKSAFTIGLAQALALIPGTSRSGVTMTAGLFLGFSREDAARFSFLLAVPVGILAGGLELLEAVEQSPTLHEWGIMAVGFVVSALSAFYVIDWLLSWVRTQTLTVFVVYRVVLGVVIFLSI